MDKFNKNSSEEHKKIEDMVQPYSDEDLELTPELESKVNNLMKFFDEYGINYDKFDPEATPTIDFGKRKAYPNQDVYMHVPGQHNTEKWLQAVREIYFKEKEGSKRTDAIRRITSGWNIMETFDFLNWLKFHEAGEHMKYKFAQLWYENSNPGYFLHIKPDPVKPAEPEVNGRDIDFARDQSVRNDERKQIIEKQRSKIIGRLDSAEKLLRSPDGQVFSGKEFEALLEAVYQLKKKIQMVNKVSTSVRIYEDMIVREANVLQRAGFSKAADTLYSLAQTPAASGEQAKGGGPDLPKLPTAPAPAEPTTPQGAPGGLPSMGPGMPQGAPSSAAPKSVENQPIGIKKFLEGIENPDDKSKANDSLEVEDTLDVEDDEELLVTEAQIAPPGDVPITDSPAPAPLDPSPVKPPTPKPPTVKAKEPVDEPLEVTEEDVKNPQEVAPPGAGNFSQKIDQVFSGVTVDDAIAEFEFISNFYKAREIPRRLSKADMMLDSLGLATFFPQLAEAQNKALESNNYISSRVEEILSKLRGSVKSKDVELTAGEPKKTSPEVDDIKQKLQSDEDKEKARKQMRKDQEAAELANPKKETPEIEIEEDLGEQPPAAKPAPAPAPAR